MGGGAEKQLRGIQHCRLVCRHVDWEPLQAGRKFLCPALDYTSRDPPSLKA